ncbi:sorting nexin-like protein [Dinothrombium tinctorium]|uniref:Sorting nexin-like protein n=1 Tax=Dinothrombium tinctorium TaxID=1965070 RepID=A0A3S3SQ27_9ACAR|nr:sorting nexin-like protein [Dinothrombium tinctorium]
MSHMTEGVRRMSLFALFAWVSLIFALFVATFGVHTLLLILSSLALLLLAAFVALKSVENECPERSDRYNVFFESDTKISIRSPQDVLAFFNRVWNTSPYRERPQRDDPTLGIITGEPEIDEQLNEVIDLLFRDYVNPWYKYISPDADFTAQLRAMIVSVIRNIAQRARSMDKVNYITTKLVDDFASHLRLYRLAESRLKFMKLEEYLTHICDILQYLLLPPDCFNSRPIRVLFRTLLVNSIFSPLLNIISDPDFIDRTLVWFLKSKLNHNTSSETFLIVLRCCDNCDELNAVLELVQHEITVHQSQDTGGEDDFDIKQQLNNLLYVQKVIKNRLKCLSSGDSFDSDTSDLASIIDVKKLSISGSKLFQIPFDVVLKNNVALSYFIEYMSSIGAQGYVYFYLNVEGFRISAEQQLSEEALHDGSKTNQKSFAFNINSLKEAASNIYDTYLSTEKPNSYKLINDETIVRNIHESIKTGKLSESWFDQAHQKVFETMRDEQRFFPNFKKSIHYIKLLAELDLLKDYGNNNNSCNVSRKSIEDDSGSVKSSGSFDSESIHSLDQAEDFLNVEFSEPENTQPSSEQEITAEITNTGVVREFGNSYGVYCITVNRKDGANPQDNKWCVLRRYSDFYTFHQSTIEKFAPLRNLSLPGKRTFNNMSQEFLEQRKHLLNSYLQQILRRLGPQSQIVGLKQHVLHFLEPGAYEKEKTSVKLQKTVNTLMNPFKTSVKTMGNVIKASSDNLKDSFQKLSKLGNLGAGNPTPIHTPLSRTNPSNNSHNAQILPPLINNHKVGKGLDVDSTEDNIPLRIMLLLMDEVFDLKSKNMWLRRRIVAVVRQIIAATFGDKINRKIVDYVQEITSATAISEYLKAFKNYLWPNGGKMQQRQERSFSTKMRTRVAAKMLLLSHLSDDFKHVIGSETTRKGLLCVFQMLQIEQLNRRLLFVLFEGFLQILFPDNYFKEIFQRLHSQSPRLKGKISKRSKWPPYLSKFSASAIVSSVTSTPSSSGKSSPLSNYSKY